MANGQAVAPDVKKRCFVVMGFGTKTDFATGRKIDLDKSYKYLIKPVVEAKGITCVRADEIPHSGVIDVPMYQELLTADVVIADISTANVNAIYELGIRHALRPSTTIVISESQLKYPFDLSHILITSYMYLEGGGIDYGEVLRFQGVLGTMLDEVLTEPKVDSPVYTYLNELKPPSLGAKAAAAAAKVAETLEVVEEEPAAAASKTAAPSVSTKPTLAILIEQGEQAIKLDNFAAAKRCFRRAIDVYRGERKDADTPQPQDSYLIQRLALATYKAKQSDPKMAKKALEDALKVLEPLKPDDSNDPETLGLAGAIEKRLFDLGKDANHLVRAIKYYTRGYCLRNDYYNGINSAYFQNVRAGTGLDPTDADKIADLVAANRTRREVIDICDRKWKAIEGRRRKLKVKKSTAGLQSAQIKEHQKKSDWEQSFWILATKAEAYFGLGEMANYEATRARALVIDPPPAKWMIKTFNDQIDRLKKLLETHGRLLQPPWPANPTANVHPG